MGTPAYRAPGGVLLKYLLMFGILLCGTTIGLVAGRAHWKITDVEGYIRRRPFILNQEAERAPKGGTLIVGDSLVERSGTRRLCGATAFVAGVSGAKFSDIAAMTLTLAKTLNPALIIIAVGTNDATIANATAADVWEREYDAILTSLNGFPIEVVAIPPIQSGGSQSAQFEQAVIDAHNAALEALAMRHHASFAGPTPFATTDGIHQSSQGAITWRNNIEKNCPA